MRLLCTAKAVQPEMCCPAAEELEQGSPLEMCYFLGKLQEPNYMLSKPKGMKGKDATIKLPLIAYSPPLPSSDTHGDDVLRCSIRSTWQELGSVWPARHPNVKRMC